eukprot:7376168-Prymnesium_polylepis.2
MGLLRDLQAVGQLEAALRLCEAAHVAEGRLLGSTNGAAGAPAVVVEESAQVHFVLSRHQLLLARRMLQKLAVPPRRWKRQQPPELLTAREVRITGREARPSTPTAGAIRRAGERWLAPDGSGVGVEEL